MRVLIILALVSLFVNGSIAQSGAMNKANGLYNKLAYYEASVAYMDLLGSGEDDTKMKLHLADCFYQIGDTERSEKYYAKVIESPEINSIDMYQYAQSLKENGKYEMSNRYMDKFIEMNESDSRGRLYERNRSYLQSIKEINPFFEISNVEFNTEGTDFGGYLIGDKIYFVSNRRKRMMVKRLHDWSGSEYLDLYYVKGDGESAVNRLKKNTNSKFHEGPICFTPDGKRVFFTRNNISKGKDRRDEDGIQNLKLFTASYGDDGELYNEVELDINSFEYSVGHPSVANDGKTIYFVSDMPGGYGGADIYKGILKEDGNIVDIKNLGSAINTEGQEMFPWIDQNGNLFFASDGHVGLGGLDVFVAKVMSSGNINSIQNVGMPVNSNKDDFGLTIDQTTKMGYVSSNRDGGKGDDDIYSIKMIRNLEFGIILNGVITDASSGEILSESLVRLIGEDGKIEASTISDNRGSYAFHVNRDKNYTVLAEKIGYTSSDENVSTKDLGLDVYEIKEDLDIKKSVDFGLYALITNARTGAPIEGVDMVIIDNLTGKKINHLTPITGDFSEELYEAELNDNLNYTIFLSKEGFVPKKIDFSTVLRRPGVYSIQAQLDLGMVEIDNEDLLLINPIYFDLDKSFLREESKIELDKIVKIMNDHSQLRIELGSHTDCRQTKAYNKSLSQRRAKESANYIKARISNPDRVTYKGYGESKLLNECECEPTNNSNCSEEEHQLNRRTEFKLLNPGAFNIKNNSPDSFGN